MPIRDVSAQIASLGNDYGVSHGGGSPNAFELALFIGDPNLDGTEVSDTTTLVDPDTGDESTVSNGYARITVTNDGDTFPAADPDTGVITTPVLSFPTSTDQYPDAVTHWLLLDADTGAGWDSGQLPREEQITVEGAGVTPALSLALFYSPVSSDGLDL